jgi:crotonobetaine/carnitine-CoA ligase
MRDDLGSPPVDSAGEVTIRSILESNAAQRPHDTLVEFADGDAWTHAQALDMAYAAAHELRRTGVGPGDRVAIAQPNGSAFLRAWWGTVTLGATVIPVNTSYRGAVLEHLLSLAEPKLIVADDTMRARIAAAEYKARLLDDADLCGANYAAPELPEPIRAHDAHVYCMTSGTTGPGPFGGNAV